MNNRRLSSLAAIFTAAIISTGCGDGVTNTPTYDDTRDFSQPFIPNSTNNATSGAGSSGGSSEDAEDTGLDCDNLDPEKVYMHVALGTSPGSINSGIADPLNPNKFCVGISSGPYGVIRGKIAKDNAFFYFSDIDSGVLRMTADTLQVVDELDAADLDKIYDAPFDFPSNPRSNDIEYKGITESNAEFFVAPSSGEIYMQGAATNSIYKANEDTVSEIYKENPVVLLASLNDDTILVRNKISGDFYHLSSTGETLATIASPEEASQNQFLYSRSTGSSAAWLAFKETTNGITKYFRWTVDIATKSIDVFEFASTPSLAPYYESTSDAHDDFAFDGDGSLYHATHVFKTEGGSDSVDLIIKYSNSSSEIIYSSDTPLAFEDWRYLGDFILTPSAGTLWRTDRVLFTGQ